jgi:hypothetical protein
MLALLESHRLIDEIQNVAGLEKEPAEPTSDIFQLGQYLLGR